MPKDPKSAAAHAAADQKLLPGFSLPDDVIKEVAGFQEEQLTFPPFWSAEVGKKIYATVVDLDGRDPNFLRYVLQAEMPIPCEQGDKGNRREVLVQKGDFFTMSAYGGLPLDRYIGMKALIEVEGEQDTGKPNPMYIFKVSLHPKDKALLAAERRQKAAQLMTQFREGRKQLAGQAQDKPKADEVPFS